MKRTVIGILAHVDAGKTTLSEAMLYVSGRIRKLGRVDRGDAYLDTDARERARGITIFSKQAEFCLHETAVTLLDTPGHADFSAEMERTLGVLDYAVLVISGTDGVQGHVRTLWRLLEAYEVPVFVFVNKMDLAGADRERILAELKEQLDGAFVDFEKEEAFQESVALCGEEALEQFLERGTVETDTVRRMILDRELFPCFFGSALKVSGVEELLNALEKYTVAKKYPEAFGARVFKIARDGEGKRLTYLKVTGGRLRVREMLEGEKVHQIRIYSGEKFESAKEAEAGCVCAVTGPLKTRPGQGIGAEKGSFAPFLEPVMSYQVIPPAGTDPASLLPKLRMLEEEEPELRVTWNEALGEIHAKVMGEVQTEILKSLIEERFGISVEFGDGNVVYKETIADCVEGVGHFEPLRHYAEVHLLLEPGDPGSGVEVGSACREDELDGSWQRLVLTHLTEREHPGVLTGSPVTDIRMTLIAGKAHLKHTEGGDFRQAAYRAVRQGLKQAKSVLLEPFYEFSLEVPENAVGRAMADLERMSAVFEGPKAEKSMMRLTGRGPVSEMGRYQQEVAAYTKGLGRLGCVFGGYFPCHNAEEVIREKGYDSERDLDNPTGSVFCSHGAGFLVSWDRVKDYMHLESPLKKRAEARADRSDTEPEEEKWIGTEEVDAILKRTYFANSREKAPLRKRASHGKTIIGGEMPKPARKPENREKYLLVDGYNIIFAWEELKDLAGDNIDGARGKLLDILCNYQAARGGSLIAVFDAYRVQGHQTEIFDYHNIHVVFTKEAETADQYIEKFAHENGKKYDVTVATSDGLEQIIIRSQGCRLFSAREFWEEVRRAEGQVREIVESQAEKGRNYLLDALPESLKNQKKSIDK